MKALALTFLDGGYCTHLERMVATDGRFRTVKFPSMFCLIRHPNRGNILFDTGYSKRFFDETRKLPEKLYAWVTPAFVEEGDLAVSKLAVRGIAPEEVDYIVLSHFHADHIAAIKDFPNATFVYLQSGFDYVARLARFSAVRRGVLRGLLPDDFVSRSAAVGRHRLRRLEGTPLGDAGLSGVDLFGDQSLYGVDLPGHMRGQMGLFLHDGAQEHFLIADACWLSRSYRQLVYPSRIAMSIMDDGRVYKDTLSRINRVYRQRPDINIAPSHCGEVYGARIAHKAPWSADAMNGVARADHHG